MAANQSNSSTKKKTTASSAKKQTAKSTAAKKGKAAQDTSFLQSEAAVLGTFAICVFLFLSNFHICGVIGDVLSQVMLGVFGSIGYVAPLLLFAGMLFYASNKGNIRAVYKMLAVEVLLIVLCGLAQLLFGGGYQEGQTLRDVYESAGVSGQGGGVIGGALVLVLHTAVGTIGSYLILLLFMIISIVCITEKSFVSAVRKGGGRAYQYARDDYDRRKEIREEKREERRLLREEQRVHGVNLKSTDLLKDTPAALAEAEKKEEAAREPVKSQKTSKISGAMEAPAGERAYKPAFAHVPAFKEEHPGAVYTSSWKAMPGSPEHSDPSVQRNGAVRGEMGTGRTAEEENRPSSVHSADVFTGKIQMNAGPAEDGEEIPFEEDLSLLRHPMDEDVFVSRDRSTLDAMDLFPDRTASLDEEEVGSRTDGSFRAEDADDFGREASGTAEKEESSGFAGAAAVPFDREETDAFVKETASSGRSEEKETEMPGKSGVSFDEEEKDSFFEEDPALFNRSAAAAFEEEEISAAGTGSENDSDEGSGAAETEIGYRAETEAEHRTEGLRERELRPERKQVVTATGKVIDTDAEEIIKKKRKLDAREKAEAESSVLNEIQKREEKLKKPYVIPPLSLLAKGKPLSGQSEKEFKETAVKLQQTLRNFGVGVTVTNISCGPTVTRYELHPEQGVKVSRILSLADDIKLNLAAADIRIEAPIPGKAAVGIEVPNRVNSTVYLRDLLESEEFKTHPSRLAFAVGKDIGGKVIVADLAKMPHLLIAGQTGSGKSVGINTMVMSFLYRSSPDDVKLILIDPKVVELSVYNGIPHLLIPVVTDPKKAAGALNWAVAEMMERYNKFAAANVRDLKGYNARVKSLADSGDVPPEEIPAKLPQIVIVIDELADLMMVASNEVEDAICRLAQLARAAGIHLVIATQRPSVNVITGVIKANIPSRIAFSVASGTDSRTILDMVGAEKLLGNGDMLFYPSGYPKPLRVQGAFVSDNEVSRVTDFLKEQNEDGGYNEEVEKKLSQPMAGALSQKGAERDELFVSAGNFIIEKDKASIGMLQRMFKIGFNRAARIMDQLAEAGVVGEEEGTKPRKVLMSAEEFEEFLESGG